MCCKECLNKIINLIKFMSKTLLCLTLFILAVYFAFIDKLVQMVSFLSAGIFLLFLFNIEKFFPFLKSVSYKDWSFVLKEAGEVVQDLKLIIKNFALLTLEETQLRICKGNPTIEKIEENFTTIKNMLEKYGISEDERENLLEKYWHKWVYRNYTKLLIDKIVHSDNFDRTFWRKWNNDGQLHQKPEKLEELLNKYPNKKGEENNIKQILDDYKYYFKNKKHKSLEHWEENLKFLPDNNYGANTPKEDE